MTKSNYILENKTIITPPSRHTLVSEAQSPGLETTQPAPSAVDSANQKSRGTVSTPADANNLSRGWTADELLSLRGHLLTDLRSLLS